MEEFILSNEERMRIFKVLCEHKRLTFNALARSVVLRSNKLSYQLKLMLERGFLVHEQEEYSLSLEAERLIPYFSQIFKKEVGVLPVILGIVRNQEKILLIQRKKLPYKGYWSIFGGKQINGETIPQTIEREILEEAHLPAHFAKYNGILYERLGEKQGDTARFKHSFLFIVTTLIAATFEIREGNEGMVSWFDFEDVLQGKVRIIPSDQVILSKYHDKETNVEHIVMHEKDEELSLAQTINTS